MTGRFFSMPSPRKAAGAVAALLLAASPSALLAQSAPPATVSQPVVQPTGPGSTRDLNAALTRVARDPRNVQALIEAGLAALQIGDSEAALGFFSRADEVSPGNGLVKAQIASALVQGENAFEAIRYFDDAERAGADITRMAADRGLAYDLIGDNARAQRWYQLALSRGADDEVTRRYALSLAIAGDRRGAETVLGPLLQRQDRAAWRTRTFILAIAGNADEAVAAAQATMPQQLATGISPYLRYMPRLTPAQQAAAANFGHFPRAADIGRDDPRVVQYAALNPRAPRTAEAGLVPSGQALGSSRGRREETSRERRRRPGRENAQPVRVAQAAPAAPLAAPVPPPAAQVVSKPVVQPTPAPAPASVLPASPAPTRVATATPLPPSSGLAQAPVTSILDRDPVPAARAAAATPARTTAPAPPALAPARTGTPPRAPTALASAPAAAPPAASASPPQATPAATQRSFDLARVDGSAPAPVSASAPALAAAPATPPQAVPVPPSAPAAAPPPAQLADGRVDFSSIFQGFTPPEDERAAPVAAVDLSQIKPGRPRAADPVRVATAPPAEPRPAREVRESKDSKDTKDAKAGKGTKATARGERPDGPSAVSRTAETTAPAKGKGGKVAPSHPSRIWVQVLTGTNRDMMDNEWRRMVRQAPDAFRARKPYITPWRSNFRLLTGPFESEAAARAFLNQLTRAKIGGFQWTSPAGQAIDTLPLK